MTPSTQSKITKYVRRQDSVLEIDPWESRRENHQTDLKIVMGTTELSRKQIQVPEDSYFWL